MPASRFTKTVGFLLLGVSTLASTAGLLLPFLGRRVTNKAAWATGLIVTGELLLALSMVFLGKEYGQKIKNKVIGFFRRRKPTPEE